MPDIFSPKQPGAGLVHLSLHRGGRLIFEEKRNALNFLEPNEADRLIFWHQFGWCEGRDKGRDVIN